MKAQEEITDTMLESANHRRDTYAFLSLCFGRELAETALSSIIQSGIVRMWQEREYVCHDLCDCEDIAAVAEELHCEYTRLFLGPGPHIAPYESVHRTDVDQSGMLWGKTTPEVKKFIEHCGLTFTEDYGGIPDHIAVELEFMSKLVEREAQLRNEGKASDIELCMETQRQFLETNILRWVPDFCTKIADAAEQDFYRGLALFTQEFLEEEQVLLEI